MNRKESPKEILGLNRITKKRILQLCRKDKLYQTPELNDVLYLHYQGFDCIECLEDYTELKCLWLESNAISEIQGLDKQTKLKCLFLQSNLIRKIENLEYCRDLDTLNLSQNHIRKIENCGFEVLPVLSTLNISSNYLRDCEGLKELGNCKNLSVLDLSNNRIDDILVVKIFALMPELKVLVLQGNPVVSKIPQYRKTLILECEKLTYLDSRPVFPKDRACAEAWKRGGYEEERKENERWNRKDRKKMRDSVNATIQLRNKNRKLEDQVSLIPSSDSEDDTKKQKRNNKIRANTEAVMDCIWDEVSEDKMSARSEMTDAINDSKKSEANQPSESGHEDEEDPIDTLITNKENTEEETSSGLESSNLHSCLAADTIQHSESSIQGEGNYDTVPEAIEKITRSEDLPEFLLTKEIENLATAEENDEENYEPLKELEENMNIFSEQESYEPSPSSQFETKAALFKVQELKNEQECLKTNNKLKTDFEELTTNLSNFVNQLEKEQEERQEFIKALFSNETSAKESSSESSDNEEMLNLEKLKLERIIGKWDNQSKLQKEDIDNKVTQTTNTNKEQIELNANWKEKMLNEDRQAARSLTASNTKEFITERYNIRSESMDDKELTESFEYIPLDISLSTRQSTEALNSLEKESIELKKLLQKLESNNEELFKDINAEEKLKEEIESKDQEEQGAAASSKGNEGTENLNKFSLENVKEIDKDNPNIKGETISEEMVTATEPDQQNIAVLILEEILESLEIIHVKQNSYKFPDDLMEYCEENDLSPKKLSQQPTASKSLPEVIKSFNEFFNKIELNQRKERKSSFEELNTIKEKSIILKELSQQSNLKQFNADTHQSLDAELNAIKRRQHEKVRRMVDRVYAQKDRYNDTLELVDDKLMVRNKHTKELQELPQPTQHDVSDSEDDYDTAQSEEEGSNVKEYLGKTQFRRTSLKTATARRSSEDLVMKALFENKQNRCHADSEEESGEEFFSLDGHDKQNLYDIDKEFLNKLTLGFSNLTEIDENHIVQCARSYEELKHCLTLSADDRCLTEEETELFEHMIQGKYVNLNENPTNLLKTLQSCSDLSKQEQLWFNKIVQESQEPKHEEGLKHQCCQSTGIDEIKMEKSFLQNFLVNQESVGFLHEEKSQESFCFFEPHSEEEKNEIEYNIDFESCAANTKILDCKEKCEISQQKLPVEREADILTECSRDETILEKTSSNISEGINSRVAEVLECNLEIIGDNEEILDALTVNAEVHF